MTRARAVTTTDEAGRFVLDLVSYDPFDRPFRLMLQSDEIPLHVSAPFSPELDEFNYVVGDDLVWLAARLVDQFDNPLPGRVTISSRKHPWEQHMFLDDDGVLLFGPVWAGVDYNLRVKLLSNDLPADETVREVKLPTFDSLAETVPAVLEPIRLTLPPWISLRMRHEDGRPLNETYDLSFSRRNASGNMRNNPDVLQDGVLRLYTMRAGWQRFMVTTDDAIGWSEVLVRDPKQHPSQVFDITLMPRSARIIGRVEVEPPAGDLSLKCEVKVEPDLPRGQFGSLKVPDDRGVFANDEGRFETRPLPPGRYNIEIREGNGLGHVTTQVEVGDGETKEVVLTRLRLDLEGVAVNGLVLNHLGEPVADVEVVAFSSHIPTTRTDALGRWQGFLPQAEIERREGRQLHVHYRHRGYVRLYTEIDYDPAQLAAPVVTLSPPLEVDVQLVPVGPAPPYAPLANLTGCEVKVELAVKAAGRPWRFSPTPPAGPPVYESVGPQIILRGGGAPREYVSLAQTEWPAGEPILHRVIVPRGVPLELGSQPYVGNQVAGEPVWILDGREVARGVYTMPLADQPGRLTVQVPVVVHPPDPRPVYPLHLKAVDARTGEPVPEVQLSISQRGGRVKVTDITGLIELEFRQEDTVLVSSLEHEFHSASRGRLIDAYLHLDAPPGTTADDPIIVRVVPFPQRKSVALDVRDAANRPINHLVEVHDSSLSWTIDGDEHWRPITVYYSGDESWALELRMKDGTIERWELTSIDSNRDGFEIPAGIATVFGEPWYRRRLHVNHGLIPENTRLRCTIRLPNVRMPDPIEEQGSHGFPENPWLQMLEMLILLNDATESGAPDTGGGN